MPYHRRVKKRPPGYAKILIEEKVRQRVRFAVAIGAGVALLLVVLGWWFAMGAPRPQ